MDEFVDIVETRGSDGYGFYFKVRATGRLYRCEPARDPRSPRFWCFRIYRCEPGGMVDISELPWIGANGMKRDEIPTAAQSIRADPNAWLNGELLGSVREWLLGSTPQPAPPSRIAKIGPLAEREEAVPSEAIG